MADKTLRWRRLSPHSEEWAALRAQIYAYFPLSDKNWDLLTEVSQVCEMPKGTIWVRKGNICNYTGVVARGIFRSVFTQEGLENTYEFYPEGHFATDYESLITRKPASFHVEALEDSTLVCLSSESLTRLYDASPEFTTVIKLIVERRLMQLLTLSRVLRFQSPMERYETFLQYYPGVIHRVPQYMIASYLGIQPETLSRVRHKLAKGSKAST